MKCHQSRPGFELESLCPFPMTITITPPVNIYTGCHTKPKDPNLSNYSHIAGKRGIHVFPKVSLKYELGQ